MLDPWKRAIAVQLAAGLRVSYTYQASGTKVVDGAGYTATYLSDCAAHVTGYIDPLGNRTTYLWNGGLLNRITDPNGQSITLTYLGMMDGSTRLQTITRPGIGDLPGGLGRVTRPANPITHPRRHVSTLRWCPTGNRPVPIHPPP